jgi:hypothetical protein
MTSLISKHTLQSTLYTLIFPTPGFYIETHTKSAHGCLVEYISSYRLAREGGALTISPRFPVSNVPASAASKNLKLLCPQGFTQRMRR